MKKINSKLFLLALVGYLILPSIVLASWWNPFTWFKKRISPASTVEVSNAVDLDATSIPNPYIPTRKNIEKEATPPPKEPTPVPPRELPVDLITTAQCLKDKGAVFYGAFWCPHCQAQKKLFGESAKFLPYVECSTPDGTGQTQICIDKKVTGYPFWTFPDGTTESGEITINKLAEKTQCPVNLDLHEDTTTPPLTEDGIIVGELQSGDSCLSSSSPWIKITSPIFNSHYQTGLVLPVKWRTCNIPVDASVQIMAGRSVSEPGAQPIAWAIENSTINDGLAEEIIPNGLDGSRWGLYMTLQSSPYSHSGTTMFFVDP